MAERLKQQGMWPPERPASDGMVNNVSAASFSKMTIR